MEPKNDDPARLFSSHSTALSAGKGQAPHLDDDNAMVTRVTGSFNVGERCFQILIVMRRQRRERRVSSHQSQIRPTYCRNNCVQAHHPDTNKHITVRAETNSNDFGRFGELFSRFEFEFCRRGN